MIYVVGFLGALVAGVIGWIAYRLREERKRGREAAVADAAKQALKDAEEAQRLENEVKGLTDEELNSQLGRDSAYRKHR